MMIVYWHTYKEENLLCHVPQVVGVIPGHIYLLIQSGCWERAVIICCWSLINVWLPRETTNWCHRGVNPWSRDLQRDWLKLVSTRACSSSLFINDLSLFIYIKISDTNTENWAEDQQLSYQFKKLKEANLLSNDCFNFHLPLQCCKFLSCSQEGCWQTKGAVHTACHWR